MNKTKAIAAILVLIMIFGMAFGMIGQVSANEVITPKQPSGGWADIAAPAQLFDPTARYVELLGEDDYGTGGGAVKASVIPPSDFYHVGIADSGEGRTDGTNNIGYDFSWKGGLGGFVCQKQPGYYAPDADGYLTFKINRGANRSLGERVSLPKEHIIFCLIAWQ